MLMAVKNQLYVTLMSIKYNVMREMINKVTFLSNIIFMVLNNAAFIIEWVVIFGIKESLGGYTLNQVLLLWGIAAGTYGVSRFFFYGAFDLGHQITNGKLDALLVQPKNVLIQAITSKISTSALGDLLYAYIILFIYGCNFKSFILFTFLIIVGGCVLAAISVILSSLAFYFANVERVIDTGDSLMTNFATYPDSIFKDSVKLILYTIIPVGITTYMPLRLIIQFNLVNFAIVIGVSIMIILLSFVIFFRGLRHYSSSNLMVARH